MASQQKRIVVLDVGGTSVKAKYNREDAHRAFASGEKMTPRQMVSEVKKLVKDWPCDGMSIGYPGLVVRGRIIAEPYNLAHGWIGFDFKKAFGCPIKLINDAAMQAFGAYRGGKMLFLGLGTGLGSTMIVDGIIEPMELGHLPYRKHTYEDYLGTAGLKKYGKKKWRKLVDEVVDKLAAALEPDETVIGGGNVHKLEKLPKGCRAGDNADAFRGGFRLWTDAMSGSTSS